MRIKKYFARKRYCNYCDTLFSATSKYNYVCSDCEKKHRVNITHFKKEIDTKLFEKKIK